jgi:arylamine N-acetyltransferase
LVLPTLAHRAQPCSLVKLILRNNTNTILTARRLVAGINQFEPHNDGTARETNMVIARSTLHILVANSWTPIKHTVRLRSSYFERLPRWIAQDFTHNECRTHCSTTSPFKPHLRIYRGEASGRMLRIFLASLVTRICQVPNEPQRHTSAPYTILQLLMARIIFFLKMVTFWSLWPPPL